MDFTWRSPYISSFLEVCSLLLSISISKYCNISNFWHLNAEKAFSWFGLEYSFLIQISKLICGRVWVWQLLAFSISFCHVWKIDPEATKIINKIFKQVEMWTIISIRVFWTMSIASHFLKKSATIKMKMLPIEIVKSQKTTRLSRKSMTG